MKSKVKKGIQVLKRILLIWIISLIGFAQPILAKDYTTEVYEASIMFGVPADIIEAVIYIESNGRNIVSHNTNGTYDIGPMQINSDNIEEFTDRFWDGDFFDPYNERQNILTGTAYLRYLYDIFGDWYKTLAAYNGGITRMLQNRTPEVSYRYAQKVLAMVVD